MQYSQKTTLAILGKETFFPFVGMFSATKALKNGTVSIVGRIDDAHIRHDFQQIQVFQKQMQEILEEMEEETFMDILPMIWEHFWALREQFSAKICSMGCLFEGAEVLFSAMGMSKIWLSNQYQTNEWYPLVDTGHVLYQDQVHNGLPLLISISPIPECILMMPKPLMGMLPKDHYEMNQRIFEVEHA